jgi:hypothetical protein
MMMCRKGRRRHRKPKRGSEAGGGWVGDADERRRDETSETRAGTRQETKAHKFSIGESAKGRERERERERESIGER